MDGRLAEDQRLARCGVGPSHVKQGCPRDHHLRHAGQLDEGSSKPMFGGFFFGLVLAEAQVARATDVVDAFRSNDCAPH